jgi:hypothetical protein
MCAILNAILSAHLGLIITLLGIATEAHVLLTTGYKSPSLCQWPMGRSIFYPLELNPGPANRMLVSISFVLRQTLTIIQSV